MHWSVLEIISLPGSEACVWTVAIRSGLQSNILQHYCNVIVNVEEINETLVNIQMNKCALTGFKWGIKNASLSTTNLTQLPHTMVLFWNTIRIHSTFRHFKNKLISKNHQAVLSTHSYLIRIHSRLHMKHFYFFNYYLDPSTQITLKNEALIHLHLHTQSSLSWALSN